MGIFKKKRKIEEIDINVFENKPIEEPVKEEVITKYELPSSEEEAIGIINKKYHTFDKAYDNLFYNYYICKFFSLAVLKDVEEFQDMASLEKQLTILKEAYEDISLKVKQVNDKKDYVSNFLNELFETIKEKYEICLGLASRIDETRKTKFNALKISSLAILLNKSGADLEKMDKRFTTLINSFKSLEEASDYIYINSGELITNLVNSLVRCSASGNKEDYRNQFNLYYFLKSDVILCLEISEWIELYNKIRHCVNVLRGVDIANYIDFSNYLDEFEIRYLILMINEEKKNMNKRG